MQACSSTYETLAYQRQATLEPCHPWHSPWSDFCIWLAVVCCKTLVTFFEKVHSLPYGDHIDIRPCPSVTQVGHGSARKILPQYIAYTAVSYLVNCSVGCFRWIRSVLWCTGASSWADPGMTLCAICLAMLKLTRRQQQQHRPHLCPCLVFL